MMEVARDGTFAFRGAMRIWEFSQRLRGFRERSSTDSAAGRRRGEVLIQILGTALDADRPARRQIRWGANGDGSFNWVGTFSSLRLQFCLRI